MVLCAVGGVVIGMRVGRQTRRDEVSAAPSKEAQRPAEGDERATLRAAALDSLSDAVLIADRDGRIRDCNSSALTLFGRHRGEVEEQFGSALRRFDGIDQNEPYRAASEHSVWVGEGWAKQPDGGMKMCQVRVMAIRDTRARIVAYAESFRDIAQDRDMEQEVRDLLYGVRAFEAPHVAGDGTPTVRDDLRILSEGFRDLDHVIHQYERLLPSLGADDPLAESIAGAANDVRSTVATVGVHSLMQEIPRALARLRAQIRDGEGSVETSLAASMTEQRPEGSRRPTA